MAPDSPWRWLFFVTLQALAAYNARQALRLWFPVAGRAAALARGFLLWCGQIVLLQLGLGLVGVLRPWALLAATAGIALALHGTGRRRPPRATGPHPAADGVAGGIAADSAARLALGLAAGFVLFWVYQLALTPPIGSDSLVYHLPFAAEWYRTGRLERPFSDWFVTLPYMPFHGELVFHWLLAPVGGEFLARFGQLPFVLFAGLSLHNILRRIGAPAGAAVVAGCALALSRPFFPLQLALNNIDVLMAYFGLAAVEEALRLGEGGGRREAVLHGLAVGLMIGTKPVGIPMAPVLLALGVALAPPRGGLLGRLRVGALTTVVMLVTGGYIYMENLVRTGSPFYPSGVKLLGIEWFRGADDPSRWDVENARMGVFETLVSITDNFSYTPIAAGLALIAMLAGMVVWGGRGRDRGGAMRVPLVLGAVPVAMSAAIFLLLPHRDSRYMLLPVGLAVGWFAWAVEGLRDRPRARIAVAAGLVLLQYLDPDVLRGIPLDLLWPPALLGILLAGAIAWGVRRGAGRFLTPRTLLGAAAVLTMAIAAAWGPVVRAYLHEREANWTHNFGPQGSGGGWQVVTRATRGRPATIACIGTAMTYPLYGETLENRVVYVHAQADARAWIHEYPQADFNHLPRHSVMVYQTLFRERIDPAVWRRNLAREGCDYVVVVPDEERLLHPNAELEWMRTDPETFEPVFAGEAMFVYRVRRTP